MRQQWMLGRFIFHGFSSGIVWYLLWEQSKEVYVLRTRRVNLMFDARTSQAILPSVKWFHAYLRWTKHRFTHRLATLSQFIGQIYSRAVLAIYSGMHGAYHERSNRQWRCRPLSLSYNASNGACLPKNIKSMLLWFFLKSQLRYISKFSMNYSLRGDTYYNLCSSKLWLCICEKPTRANINCCWMSSTFFQLQYGNVSIDPPFLEDLLFIPATRSTSGAQRISVGLLTFVTRFPSPFFWVWAM